MKPAIQAANIRFCDHKSNAVTVKWDNGDGDRRIVVVTPEKVVQTPVDTEPTGSTSSFGDNGICSTANNPDPLEQRSSWPEYQGLNSVGNGCCNCQDGGCGCGGSKKCNVNETFVAPDEALPLDGTTYKPNLAYGNGDELYVTVRGVTSSDPTLCPGPSPSPSPSPGYEWIIPTTMTNGSFVVYEGTGNEVTVLNLEPETGYYVSVYEFNEECTEYLHEPNSRMVITSCEVETAKITINVSDCRTCRAIVAMVEIRDKCGKLADIGSTDACGYYQSRKLETGMGYTIKVIAANYDEYTINNAYIKPRGDLKKSQLHPNWTQGTRIIDQYNIPAADQQLNTYDVKL